MIWYAAAFGVFGAGVAALAALVESVQWPLALPFGVALAAVHALVCHSAQHIARVSPLRSAQLSVSLSTFLAAASVAGVFFAGLAVLGLSLVSDLSGDQLLDEGPMFFGVGALAYLATAAHAYLSAARREALQSAARALEAELAAVEAELRALSAMVNPHFLFNALNSVAALTAVDPPAGRTMCLDLAELMRGQLRVGQTPFVPLSEELAMVRRYLAIEGVRFGDRLSVDERVEPACLGWPLPPLLLQPLVENAVKHGIAPCSAPGRISVAAHIADGALEIAIENTAGEARAPSPSRGGVGLDLVRRRLATVYGGRAQFRTQREQNRFSAAMRLPKKEGVE